MVEIKDIVDRESLEAWLKGQPKRSSIVVASRIALRFLPTLLHFISIQGLDKGKRTAILSALKQNLIADASSHCPTIAIPRNLEDAAAKFASELILPGADIPDAAGEAAAFAADAVYAYPYGDAAASMNKVFFALANLNAVYAEISSLEFLNIVKIDCEELLEVGNLTGVKLWLEFDDPFREIWGKLKSILKEDEVDWSFWIKWYEEALNGEPLIWEMLERIALIPPEDWTKGPTHLNGLIAAIVAEFEEKAPEVQAAPTQILERNRSVINLQLDALTKLVNDEILLVRGRNDVSKSESELIKARGSVLESILDAVEKIKAALSGDDTSTALTVIEEQLPEVLGGATELVKTESEPQVSVSIAQIGETISFLTQKGTPGTIASGMAVVDWTISHPVKWWKHLRKPKD